MLQADGRVILRPEAADISEPEAMSLLPLCVQVETGAFAADSTQEVLSQAGLERIKKGCPFPGLLESGIIPAPLRRQQLPSKPGLFCLPHAVLLPTCTSS